MELWSQSLLYETVSCFFFDWNIKKYTSPSGGVDDIEDAQYITACSMWYRANDYIVVTAEYKLHVWSRQLLGFVSLSMTFSQKIARSPDYPAVLRACFLYRKQRQVNMHKVFLTWNLCFLTRRLSRAPWWLSKLTKQLGIFSGLGTGRRHFSDTVIWKHIPTSYP